MAKASMVRNPGMLDLVKSKKTRTRFTYVAMSLFVVWHSLAMLTAAAPDSGLTASARTLFDPYLLLFGLDNRWGFFAPEIPNGHSFRYVVEDAEGNRRPFTPAEQWNPLQPTFIWFRDRYKTVMENFEDFADAAVASICKEHEGLKPVSVTLVDINQKDFSPEDRLKGKSPLDPEFLDEQEMDPIKCPAK
jgi:hypothetical protein